MNAGSELQGISIRSPSSFMTVHGLPCSQLRRVRRSASSRQRRATRNARPTTCMPSCEVLRAVQHAAFVHKASMGARNGYSGAVFLRLPTRVIEGSTAIRTHEFMRLRSPFKVLINFSSTRGLLHTRGQ